MELLLERFGGHKVVNVEEVRAGLTHYQIRIFYTANHNPSYDRLYNTFRNFATGCKLDWAPSTTVLLVLARLLPTSHPAISGLYTSLAYCLPCLSPGKKNELFTVHVIGVIVISRQARCRCVARNTKPFYAILAPTCLTVVGPIIRRETRCQHSAKCHGLSDRRRLVQLAPRYPRFSQHSLASLPYPPGVLYQQSFLRR